MVKKSLKLSSLFKLKEAPKPHPWQFLPSCVHLKTLSFRDEDYDEVDDRVDTVFFEPEWFTTSSSSESRSFSDKSDLLDYCYDHCDGESLEMIVRGVVRSPGRLFFEPNSDTSLMFEKAKAINGVAARVEEGSEFESHEIESKKQIKKDQKAKKAQGFRFRESSVMTMAMESEDPYEDFRRSMEEMVESHGVRDWEGLQELLDWYLRVNEKKNHGFIVGAFVDLLFNLASSSSSNCSAFSSTSYSSAVSSFASSFLCLSKVQNVVADEHENTFY